MDMVNLTILESTMVAICREMGIVLMKTSYSTIINAGLDFTCAIADPDGQMLAVADYCPAQIGGMIEGDAGPPEPVEPALEDGREAEPPGRKDQDQQLGLFQLLDLLAKRLIRCE